ncbi:hypothetical protein BT96DRAFT_989682 [Gymnopus androsaceus JB14]|uniref:Uncharacterized protein n=1 Tax=Gymnopus androsaceus JB14 TaxID=1447944 RepID=A0A6A4I1V2_9AGAR|nr:hypothetical protein BT96DRAFT_989682 [Gymnopus androsaceus JB14]
MPVEFTELRLGSKPANQAETKGYTVLEEHMKEFLLEIGVKKENAFTFYQLSVAAVKDSIPLIITRMAVHNDLKLQVYDGIIRQLLNTYLDEFPHLLQRWDFLPSDNDHSPDSVRRRIEEFRIPAYEHKEADPPLRRSERISSKLVESNSATLATVCNKRFALSGARHTIKGTSHILVVGFSSQLDFQRSKFNENTEVESLAEAPMIKMLKAPKPQLKENVNVIGVPFKVSFQPHLNAFFDFELLSTGYGRESQTDHSSWSATFYERQKVKLGVTPLSHLASIDSAGNPGVG